MSLEIVDAPTTDQFNDLKERIKAFNETHARAVQRDYSAASKYYDKQIRRTANGHIIPLRMTITPLKLAVRLVDQSFVHEDFETPGCEKVIWMRNLYRSLCPAGMRVEFGGDTMFKANCGSALEDVFMPVVSFVQPIETGRRSHRRRG